MRLTNNLELEAVPYVKNENNEIEMVTSTYEEAYLYAGKEHVAIGYVITDVNTGEIPKELKDMYLTAEDAIKEVFGD